MLWLSEEEVELRTGYKRRSMQCRELARQGVKFTVRHDGFPLVDRAQFSAGKKREPDWSAIRG